MRTLEQVYAFALSEDRNYFDEEDIQLIEEALNNMTNLINEKKEAITYRNE